MFSGCTYLTTAPVLPATTLAPYCYQSMFYGCTSLNHITCLATDISAWGCTDYWVYDVSSTGTFVKHPDMNNWTTGYSGIPSGWIVKDAYTPQECVKLEITADDVSGRKTNTTIYYTATTNGIDYKGDRVEGRIVTGTATSNEFEQNKSYTDTVERTITFEFMGVTATTTITQGVWVDASYEVVLNDQWRLSETQSNPDSTLYDGVYESFSNKGVDNSTATMYLDLIGYTEFDVYIRSYAESSYDYVTISEPNSDIEKATTSGNQNSGQDINSYIKVHYDNLTGDDRITITYRKDYSASNGDDQGYILIPKPDINDPKPIISGPWVTFTAEEDNSSIGLSKLSTSQTLEYSTDTATWNTFDTTTNISLNNGDKVQVRGMLSGDNMISDYTQFKMTGKIAASGNCNAIWNYQDLNVPLKERCGCKIFRNCTSLTVAPELPATTLASSCYSAMFSGCTSLTTAPELPATRLNERCYQNMFYECTSLTTAPELPATTLTKLCYNNMFYKCTSLNNITCLATDISATDCTSYWLHDVSSTGTFIKHPDMNDWTTSWKGIPEGWTVVEAELNEIWYTSSDGNVVYPYDTYAFGANIVSNTYEDGKGVIKFDNSITSIGEWAFKDRKSLTSIIIPNSVTSIGNYAFYYCTSLTSVIIPNSIISIGNSAFASCSSLTSVTIPNSVTSIGSSAFNYCTSLTSVTIPNSVTSIEMSTFEYCSSLTSVTIGNSVTHITDWTFRGCSSLTSITFEGTMEEWNSITKGSGWNYNVPATYIQCTDGQVAL